MTITATDTKAINVGPQTEPLALVPWTARAGALALDILPGVAILATTVLVALSVPPRGPWWWAAVSAGAVAILGTAVNRLLVAGVTGHSLGRAVFGITVTRRDGAPVGPWWLAGREMAHLLDTATLMVGWLWPLWDPRGRTFADMLVDTQSRRRPGHRADRRARRTATTLVLSAAAVCACGGALSYGVVRHHDQSVAQARAQIANQGPHLIEQILSYHPETLAADFEHARSLVTDKYRPQLLAQQQTVQKAGPVRNEYWVTNSAVLSATPTEATMLMFLQGERGAPPDQRYLTASVRVSFVKPAAAQWRVDNLAVVAKAQSAQDKP
ncbi:RDD family protein [Mycobacterium paraintracellulare]|uniref:RDD family protein n=1 Tax=Mycobacterium paraintracellulare TaxID=1138383 RepID=UPI0035710326